MLAAAVVRGVGRRIGPSMGDRYDLVLSSGFLAMARHCGVLAALEDRGVPIDAVCGTSSGALVGALWSAGLSAGDIAERLSATPPWRILVPSARPWRGLFGLGALRRRIARDLPERFEDLRRPFAVGVVDATRRPRILTSGPLVPAVAASCAVPFLFAPQLLDGERLADGGAADRLMIEPFREWRGVRPTVVHKVESTMGRDAAVPGDALVLDTPRSKATFAGWNDFAAQMAEARRLAEAALEDSRCAEDAVPAVGTSSR